MNGRLIEQPTWTVEFDTEDDAQDFLNKIELQLGICGSAMRAPTQRAGQEGQFLRVEVYFDPTVLELMLLHPDLTVEQADELSLIVDREPSLVREAMGPGITPELRENQAGTDRESDLIREIVPSTIRRSKRAAATAA